MTIDKIKDKKLQYNINSQAKKISALSSGKTDKYEFFTGKKILPSDQSRIEQAQSPLGEAFENNNNNKTTTTTKLKIKK